MNQLSLFGSSNTDLPTSAHGPEPKEAPKEVSSGQSKDRNPSPPGNCEDCPACDKERMMRHYTALFEHRAGQGLLCAQIWTSCPRMEKVK